MFKMTDEPRTIKAYNLRDDTKEFIGAGDVFIQAHTGLPANCTDIAPPDAPAGSVAVFSQDSDKWIVVEDHRNKLVYSTDDGSAQYISELGALPDNVTAVPPLSPFDKWNGSEWVTDTDAQQQAAVNEANAQKLQLSSEASTLIGTLQDAVDLEMATEEEVTKLTGWKKYRVLLSRIDTSTAPNIDWPPKPE